MESCDWLVVGGGIIGLATARALQKRWPDQSVTVLEKEPELGAHASGRNSGVLHAGLYYPSGSLKAKLCRAGAVALRQYCEDHDLAFQPWGKVVVPTSPDLVHQLDALIERGGAAGVTLKKIDSKELREIEPLCSTDIEQALYSPETAAFDPQQILLHLAGEFRADGGRLLLGTRLNQVNPKEGWAEHSGRTSYGHLINCAGAFADQLSHRFDVGRAYRLLPFKGRYFKLNARLKSKMRGHIYPVPDLSMPFLGVHFTKAVNGDVYVGPTATPALGRENYEAFQGIEASMVLDQIHFLSRGVINNTDGFRSLMAHELKILWKQAFLGEAQRMVPDLGLDDLVPCEKRGIRPQLIHQDTGRLEMDFKVESGDRSTHVLNAISPAFTCAFAFADYLVENCIDA